MIEQIANSTSFAFANVWDGIISFVPALIAALIVFIIGWFLSIGIGKLIAEILRKLKFNNIFKNTGWQNAFKKADIEVDPAQFVGVITKWILVVVFLMIASDIVGWGTFTYLLENIVYWIPNLIVSIIILVVAIVTADILEKIVGATVDKMGVSSASFLGKLTKWVIYAIAILAILSQLQIAPIVVNSIIIGLTAMIALAFGLAFGIGGIDHAKDYLTDLKKKIGKGVKK
jgi:hypothetical protein